MFLYPNEMVPLQIDLAIDHDAVPIRAGALANERVGRNVIDAARRPLCRVTRAQVGA